MTVQPSVPLVVARPQRGVAVALSTASELHVASRRTHPCCSDATAPLSTVRA